MASEKKALFSRSNIALYLLSLVLYVLISELIYSLMGFLFFPENLWHNFYQTAISLGIIYWLNQLLERNLDERLPWSENPVKRFKWQTLWLSFGTPFLIIATGLSFQFAWVILFNSDVFIQWRLVLINYFILAFVLEINVAFSFGKYFIEQWQESKVQSATFEKEKAQFNLELLRNQINPHFLFNNLNTLSALIYESQDKAAGFVRMLSKVYRNILEYRNKETVSLEEELQFFDSYMQLLGIRFQDMIKVNLVVDKSLHQKRMIPLTLQLLIENAIKHNVVSKQMPLEINIRSEADQLVVSNPIRKKESLDYSSGLGLKIISNRYEYLTDRPFVVKNNGTHFTLYIPLL